MLNVGGSKAAVTGWTSPTMNVSCTEAFWARAAAWSPNDSTIYLATTGYHEPGTSTHGPRKPGTPCDVVMAFPADADLGEPSCGTTRPAVTRCTRSRPIPSGVYVGGHERYSMNQQACDTLGTGGYNAPGMEGLDPANGNLFVNPANSAGYYSRARGLGADDMLITSVGLWIASDNLDGSQTCGGVFGLAGICLLPYS